MDFSRIKGLILDMDGVLWRGDQPLLDLRAFFAETQERGLQVILATNNATKSVSQYLDKLSRYGVILSDAQIANSAMSAAFYLKQKYPQGNSIFVVGETGLVSTLQDWGFQHAEDDVVAVVAGLDRTLTYPKLSRAVQLIRAGAEFVGTNPDLTFPSASGLTPGAGAVLAFIQAGADTAPVITGKPEPFMFNLALQRMGLAPDQVLTVGDRLDTDILGGQRAGCPTAVVLSGVATHADILNWSPAPDLVLPNLADLLGQLSTKGV